MWTINQALGRLERVDLRRARESEGGSFTLWLGRGQNLKLPGS